MTAWKLPLIVAGIAIPIVAGFLVAGPGLGLAVGALVAVVIVFIAVRQRPLGPIVSAPLRDFRRHVLIVVTAPVEDPAAVERIAVEARVDGDWEEPAEILILAPARNRFLDRWASDLAPARRRAQESLVVTVASLARANINAQARVGDEDLVQAVEDQLRSFPATEVILATGRSHRDPAGHAAARELASRLEPDFRHLELE